MSSEIRPRAQQRLYDTLAKGGSWHVFHLYYAVRGKVYVGSEAKCMGNIGSLVRWFNKREADLGTKRRIMPGEEVYTYRLIEG